MDKKTNNDLLGIVRALSCLPCSKPFLKPVDVIALGIPDYLTIIDRPMDLGTIKTKLTKKEYTDKQQFLKDVYQVFDNCRRYNTEPRNPVRILCEDLQTQFELQWTKLEDGLKVDKNKDDTMITIPAKREPENTIEVKRLSSASRKQKSSSIIKIPNFDYDMPEEKVREKKPKKEKIVEKIIEKPIERIIEKPVEENFKKPEIQVNNEIEEEPDEVFKEEFEESERIDNSETSVQIFLPPQPPSPPEIPVSPPAAPQKNTQELWTAPITKKRKNEEVIYEEELNYDKLTGRDESDSIIKFKIPEIPQEEIENNEDAPAPIKFDSNEYMKAVLQPIVDADTKRKLRSILYKTMLAA